MPCVEQKVLSAQEWKANHPISNSTSHIVLEYIDRTIYIIILDPDERRPTTVRSNDTLVDTPFQLISGFFHVNQGILCSEHAEQASSRGVLERGGATTGSGLKPIRLQV